MNRITDYAKLAEGISSWIRDYAVSNNIKSLVVGVSGGIDSAVVSALCARTGLPTFCPIIDIYSNKEHTELAIMHGNWLEEHYKNCSYKHTNMDNTMSNIMIPSNGNVEHLAANTKSRLRMLVLYNYASAGRGIVVGTGNRVEDFGIGYCTKGGDLTCDISPIGDLYKTEVRELGRYLGVSEEICQAAPCDGLFTDSRTDEECIGATYEELEWAMDQQEKGEKYDCSTHRQIQVAMIYDRLHRENQHKMLPIPIYKLPL